MADAWRLYCAVAGLGLTLWVLYDAVRTWKVGAEHYGTVGASAVLLAISALL